MVESVVLSSVSSILFGCLGRTSRLLFSASLSVVRATFALYRAGLAKAGGSNRLFESSRSRRWRLNPHHKGAPPDFWCL